MGFLLGEIHTISNHVLSDSHLLKNDKNFLPYPERIDNRFQPLTNAIAPTTEQLQTQRCIPAHTGTFLPWYFIVKHAWQAVDLHQKSSTGVMSLESSVG